MRIAHSLAAWLTLFTLVGGALAAAPSSPRAKMSFNAGWRVMVGDAKGAEGPGFDDSQWKSVTVPYSWNEHEAFAKDIHDLSSGVAWYRKRFKVPPEAAGKKIYLEFEGIRQAGDFWLNGKRVGFHENGVMAFGIDISSAVRHDGGENVLAARIDSSWTYRERATDTPYQWADRNFNCNYGGINKRVWLHIADPLHQTLPLFSNLGTTGVYVHAKDHDVARGSATITAETQVCNDSAQTKTLTYEVIIDDPDGRTIKTIDGGQHQLAAGETAIFQANARVDGLHFWSWGYGYLYDAYTILKVDGKAIDVVKTRTGFRQTEFANGALKLNGRTLQVKGYAQRTTNEWPAVGIAIPPWLSDFSNRLMVESNANTIRWMHVTPSKQDVESCDRIGLIQAMPAGDSERDPDGRRWEMRVELMRDAIIYNRNNPSILFYECGNKGISEEHMAQMKTVRDQYDPHGGRAIGCREMLDSTLAEYGGEMLYINKSAGKPMWAMEYSRDEGLRKYWDKFTPPYHDVPQSNRYIRPGQGQKQWDLPPAHEYNRNQDSHAIENVTRWHEYWRERPGTGRRVSGGGVNIIFSDTNTHFRGMENYRRSGEVDAMRIPKDGFYAHQVMWDGWVDVEQPRAHIIGHWNYEPTVTKDVHVVSSADRVELLVNGQSLGYGTQSDRFLFTFPAVKFQPGTLKAIGKDSAGKVVCEAEKRTAGAPAALRLKSWTGPGGFRADGSDLALVEVEVIDADGNRCPTAMDTVDFELTGPAEWRGGIGHEDGRRDNFILAKSLPVACGVNRVLIRSTIEPGSITLSASAKGLKPATIQLKTVPGESATIDPPAYLGRGPTPAGDSLNPTRTPCRILAAKAGSNSEQAAASYDDNERSAWSSESLSMAWIAYELDGSTPVSEITMKLGDFRTRSYPIRILVDGVEAFNGSTTRTLGYCTITFPPVTGKTVRVELIGAGGDRDAFGNIVEVAPQEPATTRPGRTGSLNIAEIEIYGPPARPQ